jgi:hypothetical protein
MDKTPEAIIAFARARAEAAWERDQQPYLLAFLSPDLTKEDVDYKEVLGGQRLKDFLSAATAHIKLVFHPHQKSKIGIIPADKDYIFPVAAPDPAPVVEPKALSEERGGRSLRRYIVSQFLQLVADLDDEDAAQVQIPTHILAKLLREQ